MDKINALKHRGSRLKKLTNEDTENESFILKTDETRKCIRWTIENIDVCPLVKGEYLESPPFLFGYLNSTKCTLRLYPRGRNSTNLEKVGLFIKNISSSARCFVNYEFKLLDSYPIEGYFRNQSVFEDPEERGTDEFLSIGDLSNVKFLKIECNILVTYFSEAEKYQIREKAAGFPRCTCTLSEDLRNLYHRAKHADAVLKIGKVDVPVHKVILGARSRVFSDMLKGDKKRGSGPNVITLEHVESSTEEFVMRDLIEYIYTGTIDNLTADKAISLYPVTKKYSLKELKKLCTDKILATMSAENFCCIAALADVHQSSKMKVATKNFFCNYSAQILDREDWKNFIFERRSMASKMMEALASDMKAKCEISEPDD